MRKLASILIMIGILFVTAACGSSSTQGSTQDPAQGSTQGEAQSRSEPITLKYAFFAADTTYPAIVAKKWAEKLEERTNGKVKIEFYFGGTLLNAANTFDGVKNGVADVGLTALSYEPGRFPLAEISDLPSGYPNAKVGSQVVSNLMKEFPEENLKEFKVAKMFTTEPLYIQTKDPVGSLEELEGQQLRIGGALTPLLEALGAAPVGMSQAEQAQALQTGVISGYVSERALLKDAGFAEFVKYYTDYPLGLVTLTAVMNQQVYESLPADVQQAIDELYDEMPAVAGEYLDNHVQEAIAWSEKEHGLQKITLSADEIKRWEEKIQPLQEKAVENADAKGLPGTKYEERLYELVSKYSGN